MLMCDQIDVVEGILLLWSNGCSVGVKDLKWGMGRAIWFNYYAKNG